MKRKEVLSLLVLSGVLAFSAPVMSFMPQLVVCAAEADGIPRLGQNIFSEGNFNIPNDASLSSAGNLYLGITALDNAKYVTECQGQYYPTKYESEEYDGEIYASTYTEYTPMLLADAVSQASPVPVGTSFYFDANPSSIGTLNEYNEASKNIYLIVLQGDTPVGKVPFSELNSVIGVNSGAGSAADGNTSGIMKDFGQTPVVTFSEIPESTDREFELVMYSDIDALLTFNGKNKGKHGQSDSFMVNSNGDYSYSAVTADGQETTGVLSVGCFTGDGVALPSDSDRDNVWKGTGQEAVGAEGQGVGEDAGREAGDIQDSAGTQDSSDSQERLYQTGIESSIPAMSGVLGLGGIGFLLVGLKRGRKGGNDEN